MYHNLHAEAALFAVFSPHGTLTKMAAGELTDEDLRNVYFPQEKDYGRIPLKAILEHAQNLPVRKSKITAVRDEFPGMFEDVDDMWDEKRIENADTTRPLIVARAPGENPNLVDGRYRLEKLLRAGNKTVQVQQLPDNVVRMLMNTQARSRWPKAHLLKSANYGLAKMANLDSMWGDLTAGASKAVNTTTTTANDVWAALTAGSGKMRTSGELFKNQVLESALKYMGGGAALGAGGGALSAALSNVGRQPYEERASVGKRAILGALLGGVGGAGLVGFNIPSMVANSDYQAKTGKPGGMRWPDNLSVWQQLLEKPPKVNGSVDPSALAEWEARVKGIMDRAHAR